MIKPNVLILADKEDVNHLDVSKQSDQWNIFWKIIDYNKLPKSVDELRNQIKEYNIDFIVYSRNDQVVKKIRIGPVTKKLKIGYSSFSGIDEKYRIEEMKNCCDDFISCDNHLDFNITPPKERDLKTSDSKGSFSLLFDTEQIGGVRYALPRILKLLNEYDVKATFFVTNLMKKVYPNVIDKITEQGHEIGLHGRWHEYLSKSNSDEQVELIKNMVDDFGYPIHGANFIGRMNGDTVHALTESEIKYFVYPLMNYYRFLCYPKLPTNPFLVSSENGEILMIPISLETYGCLWFSIKNMIDSAYRESLKTDGHITILCHPFRDGNLQHLGTTEKLIKHLRTKKMYPVLLEEAAKLEDKKYIKKVKGMDLGIDKTIIPKTKKDVIGFLPENLIMMYKILKRGKTVW